MKFHFLLCFLPCALSAIISTASVDPKVSKAVDAIILVVQNELHHIVNDALLEASANDADLISEVEKIVESDPAVQADKAKEIQAVKDDSFSEHKKSLSKRYWGYPYYG